MKFNPLQFLAPLARRCAGLALMALSGIAVQAQSANSMAEYRVKAAYIFNFAKYVDWPVADSKQFQVCSAGRDDLGGALSALDNRLVQGRAIQVRQNVAMDQLKDCQIIFVGERDSKMLTSVVRQMLGTPVLIVTDNQQTVEAGAHIILASAEDRVEFDVNLATLQRSNLKASSQMLKLARNTKPAKP
ncbi:YfiR family protein [Limnohabitans sp. Rim8]|uniref:YfiR family protein n=1 Tax=Limnohabitans sp. Rim8 TaxID=1100718 RepID=UPI003305E31C